MSQVLMSIFLQNFDLILINNMMPIIFIVFSRITFIAATGFTTENEKKQEKVGEKAGNYSKLTDEVETKNSGHEGTYSVYQPTRKLPGKPHLKVCCGENGATFHSWGIISSPRSKKKYFKSFFYFDCLDSVSLIG